MDNKEIINLCNNITPEVIEKVELEDTKLPHKLLKSAGSSALKKAIAETSHAKSHKFRWKKVYTISIASAAILIFIFSNIFLSPSSTVRASTIAEPNYPKKTDYHSHKNKYNKIDKNFLDNLNNFSSKSSSIVLSQQSKNTNSIYSPISLYMALSLAANSAGGNTQKEILSALSMGNTKIDAVSSETRNVFQNLYKDNQIGRLVIANSLWLNKNINFKKPFLKNAAKNYYAHSFSVDFKSNETSKKINSWISKFTGGKLKGSNDTDPNQIMSLINTVYFYDEWSDRFDSKKTSADTFYLSNGDKTRCDFMNMAYGSHSYVKTDNCTISSLYFKNGEQMIFILPDKNISPYDLIKNPKLFSDAVNSLNSKNAVNGSVTFKIPKFNFSNNIDLKKAVESLGIKSAFNSKDADFSNLSYSKNIFLSGIIQSSCISIDEKGCEASSFTELFYAGSSKPNGHADMILNRPFIFAITGSDNIPIFTGVINNPSK